MVAGNGRVKIADFGIAQACQAVGIGTLLTAMGITAGTPAYMAPEQVMGGDVGPWTDLYAIGVMAWEQMVGRLPFPDGGRTAVLMRQVNQQIPSAIRLNPETDPDVSAWIDRLLVKDPHWRPSSPSAAWDELEEIVVGRLGPYWRRDVRLIVLRVTPVAPARRAGRPPAKLPARRSHGQAALVDRGPRAGHVEDARIDRARRSERVGSSPPAHEAWQPVDPCTCGRGRARHADGSRDHGVPGPARRLAAGYASAHFHRRASRFNASRSGRPNRPSRRPRRGIRAGSGEPHPGGLWVSCGPAAAVCQRRRVCACGIAPPQSRCPHFGAGSRKSVIVSSGNTARISRCPPSAAM